jgi:hypothetical protein
MKTYTNKQKTLGAKKLSGTMYHFGFLPSGASRQIHEALLNYQEVRIDTVNESKTDKRYVATRLTEEGIELIHNAHWSGDITVDGIITFA